MWIRLDGEELGATSGALDAAAATYSDAVADLAVCCDCMMPTTIAGTVDDTIAAAQRSLDDLAAGLTGDATDLGARGTIASSDANATTAASAAWGPGTTVVAGTEAVAAPAGLTYTIIGGDSIDPANDLTIGEPSAQPAAAGLTVSYITDGGGGLFEAAPLTMGNAPATDLGFGDDPLDAQVEHGADLMTAGIAAMMGGPSSAMNRDVAWTGYANDLVMEGLEVSTYNRGQIASPLYQPSDNFDTQSEYEHANGLMDAQGNIA